MVYSQSGHLFDAQRSELWIVGGGIAGMAAAAFAIRDAGVPGRNIHILEETGLAGGSMDGSHASTNPLNAWVTRGGRMFTDETYLCTWDLFNSIPSRDNPLVSVREEVIRFNQRVKTDAKARLIDKNHQIIDASRLGLSMRNRLEMMRLLATSEERLGSKQINEYFSADFFDCNFWRMWRTTFAFQKWHSAAELRRYLLRFVQEFARLHTLGGVRRTRYNQYDSMIVPLQRWLLSQGVDVRFGQRVTDVDFLTLPGGERRASALHLHTQEGEQTLRMREQDLAFITLGSITSDARLGGNDTVPELVRDRRDHGWSLWENIARKAPDFGRPIAFCGNVDEHKWESFTFTMHDDTLLKRVEAYSGNAPGTGALMTFFESGWHISLVVPHQPHFADLPTGHYTLWGYGFEVDKSGDYVRKPMGEATGREILTEVIKQLGFDDILDHVLATTDVTTAMLPYASALFACRTPHDRPQLIPTGSQNFAFMGQFVEIPEDVVFTVEYSVRCAMLAVYRFFGVERTVPAIYHGLTDPSVGINALETAFR